MSNIVTFYSYKGGVGRSMSLANVAVLLGKWGHKVLIVDWDLEAPGLEHFFKSFIDLGIVKERLGVIDLLGMDIENTWQDLLIPISIPECREPIHMISSGKRDEDYFKKVRNFNIENFYESGGGEFIEKLRDSWKQEYDFILLDSRTGVTEIGGICAVQLPDQVVMLFTATDQGFEGTLDISKRALKAQQGLPFDRQKLTFIPVLTKFDTQAEFELSERWIDRFADKLKDIYNDWLPISIKKDEFIRATKVPYITYFSFGEKLPVIEQSLSDTSGLAYSYESLAGLLANSLNDLETFMFSRDKFIEKTKKGYVQVSASSGIKKNRNEFKIFISYSQKDQKLKSELVSYLSLLTKKHNVTIWSDEDLMPGDDWNSEIEKNLAASDVVLLLITPDYLDSPIAHSEFDTSVRMNKRVIPIIFKSTDISGLPISRYLALPRNLKPINDSPFRQEGFIQVTEELEKLILSMRAK